MSRPEDVAARIMITVVFIVGFLCNTLTILVLRRRNSLGTRLLLYLAYVDIIMLLLQLLMCLPTYFFPMTNATVVYACLLPFIVPLMSTVYTAGAYITVLVAVQRSLIMAVPLKFLRYTNETVFSRALVGIGVFSVIFNVPVWIAFRPKLYWNDRMNVTLVKAANLTDTYWIYDEVRPPVDSIIPLLVILLCDVIIAVARYRSTPVAGQDKRSRGKNQLSNIVVAITTMSMVIHLIVSSVYLDFMLNLKAGVVVYYLIYVKKMLIFLNSAINFFFYCLFGPEFRHTLVALLRRRDGQSGSARIAQNKL